MATVNKQAVVAAFRRATVHYGQHTDLQRQSADALLTMLPQRKYTHILDAGYGPGRMSHRWRKRHTQVTVSDLSPPVFVQARQENATDHYLAGDIESLPLATATFDFAWNNLAVRWYGDLSTTLRELYRVVRPGGVVVFTTLVQGSSPELHQAWQAVDERPHANRFLLPDEIEQSLNGLHYRHHIQPVTLWFDNALSAMRSPRDIGTTHLHKRRDP